MAIKAIYDKLEEIPTQFQELFTERGGKYELTGVEGIQTQANVLRLETALQKEREDHKKVKENLNKFSVLGSTPEELIQKLDLFEEYKLKAESTSGTVDETKIQAIVDSKVAREKAVFDRQVKSLLDEKSSLTTQLQELSGTITRSKLETALRKAAESAKVNVTAIEDIVIIGERMFEVTNDGKIFTKDGLNSVQAGLSPEIWLSDMKNTRPHWFPTSQGGGANGSGGANGGANNPWTKEGWNMTKQGETIRTLGMEKASQMAKLAGSEIGATSPATK